jgi:hypothetical protein
MSDALPQPPSPASLPPSSILSTTVPSTDQRQTRGKGKARAQAAAAAALPAAAPPVVPAAAPPVVPAAVPPYELRGTKRREVGDLSADPAASPFATQDAHVPRVQVEEASPPRPTQRAKIVATGDVCILLFLYLLPVLIPHSGQMWSLHQARSRQVRTPRKRPFIHCLQELL